MFRLHAGISGFQRKWPISTGWCLSSFRATRLFYVDKGGGGPWTDGCIKGPLFRQTDGLEGNWYLGTSKSSEDNVIKCTGYLAKTLYANSLFYIQYSES